MQRIHNRASAASGDILFYFFDTLVSRAGGGHELHKFIRHEVHRLLDFFFRCGPTENGMDLIQACRRINPRQKIILVSGTVDETIYHHAEQKPDGFLAKPYQAKQLADLVREVLAE